MARSRIPWISELPAHWGVERGKSLFNKMDRPVMAEDGIVTCFRDGIVTLRSRRRTSGFTEALKEIGYQGVRPGDLVIHGMDAFAGAIGVSDSRGKSSPVYSVCVPKGDANPFYFAAVLREMARSNWILALSKGIRERSSDFRFETFGRQLLPVPPVVEQEAIVRYLLHATVRINSAISAKRRLVALLEERKNVVLREAMKCPSHGDRELRHVITDLVDCEHKTAPFAEGTPWWVLRTSAVRAAKIDWNGAYTTDRDSYEEWTRRAIPQPGDVIFTREAPVGEAAVLPQGRAVCLGQRTVLMKVKREVIDPDFLVLQIYGGRPRERISFATQGSTVGHFNMDDIRWMRIAVPSLEEQRTLVARVTQQNEKTDLAIARAQSEIALLSEFRTRLVADVTTGQLDVRRVAAGLHDDVAVADWATLNLDEAEDLSAISDDELSEANEDC